MRILVILTIILLSIGIAAGVTGFITFVQGIQEKHQPSPTRPEFGTEAPDCRRFHQTDHVAWCDCMGVPYK